MHFSSLLAAGLLGLAAALPEPTFEVHERREAPLHAWTKRGRVPGEDLLPVRIGMAQSNLDRGHDMLMEVSDPSSPKYGQHYTAEEVIDIFAPSQESIEAVKEWLVAHGGFAIHRISLSANKQWMQLDAKAHELEALLRTEYHVYDHASGKRSVACDQYHLPEHVRRHVDYITPGINLLSIADQPQLQARDNPDVVKARPFSPKFSPLPEPLPKIFDLPTPQQCLKLMTPNCIQLIYNISKLHTAAKGNSIGVYESFGQTWSQSDLNGFFKKFQQRIPQGTGPTDVSVDGGKGEGSPGGGESTLDLDCVYPIVYPTNVTFYAVDDQHYDTTGQYDGLFNTFLDAIDGSYCNYTAFGITGDTKGGTPAGIVPFLDPPYPDPATGGYKGKLQCGVYKPTKVISISYSLAEFFTPMNYQRRQCNEFMKLGLQGVSVTVATGDDGVANNKYLDPFTDNGCLWGNQSNFPQKASLKKPVFNPGFPVTCPYLTTVGATVYKAGGEVATSSFGSAGGFSNIYPIPSYQQSAVATFFKDHAPPYKYYTTTYNKSFAANGGVYNRGGRGFPDVAAVGDLIAVYEGGAGSSGGTSASAPIFGAVLSRLNDARLKAGKSTIGFANPALYKNPAMFHDIVKGDNTGCNTNGFRAVPGWDPVTGLGTPKYPAMEKYFLSLP